MKVADIKSLKKGDKVRVTRTFIVESNGGAFSVKSTDGKTYYDIGASKSSDFKGVFGDVFWDIELVERHQEDPEHWPPQKGDLWKDADGNEYFVMSGYAFSEGNSVPLTALKKLNPVLIHRKGNNPRI